MGLKFRNFTYWKVYRMFYFAFNFDVFLFFKLILLKPWHIYISFRKCLFYFLLLSNVFNRYSSLCFIHETLFRFIELRLELRRYAFLESIHNTYFSSNLHAVGFFLINFVKVPGVCKRFVFREFCLSLCSAILELRR